MTCHADARAEEADGYESVIGELDGDGQSSSEFIDEMFPGSNTSDFVGSVRCMAADGGMFAASCPWRWMPPTGSSPPSRWCRWTAAAADEWNVDAELCTLRQRRIREERATSSDWSS